MDPVTPDFTALAWQEANSKRIHVERDIAGHFARKRVPF